MLECLSRDPGMAGARLVLRRSADTDAPFLFNLYVSVRQDEFSALGWDTVTLRAFLQTQFHVQRRHYHAAFPSAEYLIVEHEGSPVGQLCLFDQTHALRIVDISLLPEARNKGMGHAIMAAVQRLAASGEKAVTLSVISDSPARRLYVRLGFQDAGLQGPRTQMQWRQSSADAAS
jgi:ribosomal protein S18 acetylase RimI-like enzyme